MSGGRFEVTGGPLGGFVILPAMAIGMLLAMPIALTVLGWWKYARRRTVLGISLPMPGRETTWSAFWMAWIVGTTTLNFTFPGASIIFVLVLMRIETLLLSPTIDFIRHRKIHVHSWVAIGLSLLSAAVALSDVKSYDLTALAVASLLLYLMGYTNRFLIMSRHAKENRLEDDRRYLVEEHMATPVFLVALLGAFALAAPAWISAPLREGFTTILTSAAAWPALAIGVFYEGLFISTTLIFLDRREFSFCMPVHVCASLLAGIAASLALTAIYGSLPPTTAQLLAAICVLSAALALSYPAIRARILARRRTKRIFLFVCGGNTIRSPMAAAVAQNEFDTAGELCEAWSAGVSVHEPGRPLEPEAADALRSLNVPVPQHAARPLTAALCARSSAVYCMTRGHRDSVLKLAPEASARIMCLDPKADIADPHGDSHNYVDIALRIRDAVQARLLEQARSGLLERTAHYSRASSGGA